MKLILIIIALIALPIAIVYVYRNNKKVIDPIADKVAADEKAIVDTAKKL